MPVYLISDITVRDPAAFEAYRTRAAASIAAFGGCYLVRGGAISVLEGERHPTALVLVEVPDAATAALVRLLRIRHGAGTARSSPRPQSRPR